MAMNKCDPDGRNPGNNQSRNSDSAGSNQSRNSDRAGSNQSRNSESFGFESVPSENYVGRIPAVPALPELPSTPQPLEPMAAPQFLAAADPMPLSSTPPPSQTPSQPEAEAFAEFAPSIRQGLIDVTPEEALAGNVAGIAPEGGNQS